ncbi:MAG: flagellar biosynthesis anti-sigma factor FlgM [Thiovulaceae bacterium]|nr:flagellar biosynthesis anti-sigma factor FlgM [Sulfurimonadaceae bacterium]MCW9026279.1 flagellar biosynthesis anti-sigma factor FlgM [Sulfurimonadaceae bacterium]
MISKLNNNALSGAYSNNTNEAKQAKSATRKAEASISSQGDTSKIDRIKSDIASGQYKVNLEALSQKIADELL